MEENNIHIRVPNIPGYKMITKSLKLTVGTFGIISISTKNVMFFTVFGDWI